MILNRVILFLSVSRSVEMALTASQKWARHGQAQASSPFPPSSLLLLTSNVDSRPSTCHPALSTSDSTAAPRQSTMSTAHAPGPSPSPSTDVQLDTPDAQTTSTLLSDSNSSFQGIVSPSPAPVSVAGTEIKPKASLEQELAHLEVSPPAAQTKVARQSSEDVKAGMASPVSPH